MAQWLLYGNALTDGPLVNEARVKGKRWNTFWLALGHLDTLLSNVAQGGL